MTLEDAMITDKRQIEEKLLNKENLSYKEHHLLGIINEKSYSNDPDKLLELTDLMDVIINEVGKRVVGERETIKTIILCSFGSLVKNHQIASYNLLVNDESGVGKDYVCNAALDIFKFDKDKVQKRTRITPTAFTYWNTPYKDKKTGEIVNKSWTWDGKICYLEDISDNVFNHEVFKVMCSTGSKATVVIKQVAYSKEIEGKPVMIVTSANTTPSPELTRRFVIVNLDASANQTTAIIKRQAELAERGIDVEYSNTVIQAIGKLKRIKVIIPYANKLTNIFPTNKLMRTHFQRFLDYIKASSALYQKQRECNERGFYIATKEDYELAREVFLKITSNPYMIPLTRKQKSLLEFMKQVDVPMDIKEIATKCTSYSERMLYNVLPDLQEKGFLKARIEENDENYRKPKKLYWYSKDMDLSSIVIPTWDELGAENGE